MKVTILGCGSSGGVPLVGCACPVCTSANPRNTRLRVSIAVQTQDKTLLVDTSPDLRQQCLANDISKVDAILYTHDHADHCHGIDDVRPFNHASGAAIECYATAETLINLKERFPYAFLPPIPQYGWFRPCLAPQPIRPGEDFAASGVTITPFEQTHGKITSLGFRFGKFAYSTDVNELSEDAFKLLEGIEVWVVDCLREEEAPTHAHLEKALTWINRVKPRRAILTHMNHDLEYNSLKSILPDGVEPAHDGLVVQL